MFVLLFHIDSRLMPGGYVGVDIFFVISGYLITRHVVMDLQKKSFSLVGFYSRRVKRIAPAMLVVLVTTCSLAYFFTIPDDFKNTAQSAAWSLASLANVYFWLFQDQGYFAQNSQELPLLHLWSLGVEEQFYAIWPLVLIFIFRGDRRLTWVVISVAAASFVAGELLFANYPSFVYYMLPTRAGELLLGAIAAMMVLRGHQPSHPSLIAATGALLVLFSGIALSEHDTFPGLRALGPTLGAGLLIFAGCLPNPISRALAVRPLVRIGLVSYSAYLWHWPLLAFHRYGYGEPGPISGAAIFVSTFLLAGLTYRYIEQPARRVRWSPSKIFLQQYVAPSSAVFSLLVVAVYFGHPNPVLARLREQTKPAYSYDYVCQRDRINERDLTNSQCVLGNSGEGKVLLWGDSNAAHYVGMVAEFAMAEGFSFRNLAVSACPPLLQNSAAYTVKKREANCSAALPLMRRATSEANVIILSASYTAYERRSKDFLDALFATVRQLRQSGKRVILIGKVPEIPSYDRKCPQKSLLIPGLTCMYPAVAVSHQVAEMNSRLAARAASEQIEFFDPTPYICPSGRCSVQDDDGSLLYYDTSHLTLNASWALGKRIVATDGVPKQFVGLATLTQNSR